MHCEGFCAILTAGTRPFAALSVFQYTGFAVSKQTETGKPCLTFFFLSAIIVGLSMMCYTMGAEA